MFKEIEINKQPELIGSLIFHFISYFYTYFIFIRNGYQLSIRNFIENQSPNILYLHKQVVFRRIFDLFSSILHTDLLN